MEYSDFKRTEKKNKIFLFENCLLCVNQAICILLFIHRSELFLHVPYYVKSKQKKKITRTRKIINERAVLSTIQAHFAWMFSIHTQIHIMRYDRFH